MAEEASHHFYAKHLEEGLSLLQLRISQGLGVRQHNRRHRIRNSRRDPWQRASDRWQIGRHLWELANVLAGLLDASPNVQTRSPLCSGNAKLVLAHVDELLRLGLLFGSLEV